MLIIVIAPLSRPCHGQLLKPGKQEQIGEYVREVFQDRKGNMWFGTLTEGLARWNGKELVYFTQQQGLIGNQINGLAEDAQGNLWIATTDGVSKFDGNSFTNFSKKNGLNDNGCWSIFCDNKGSVWVGTEKGVCRNQGSGFMSFPIPKPNVAKPTPRFSSDLAWSIIEDQQGNMWFGTDGVGVCRFDGHTFKHFTTNDGLSSNSVVQVLQDKSGKLWFACWGDSDHGGGVFQYDGKSIRQVFRQEPGLATANINPVYKDKSGIIWIASMNHGLYRYDGINLRRYSHTDRNDLTKNFCIHSILEDKEGKLWLGFSGGLFQLADDSLKNVTRTSLKRASGLQ
ncbi:MAG: two-component regulator propeller domain-containing protein [Pirellulales bacterium]